MKTKIINQKAYLERYMSSGVNEEKKKLKTGTKTSNRIKPEREYKERDRKSRSYSNMKNERKKSRWNDETTDFERGHTEDHSKDHHGRMTKMEFTGEGQAPILRDKESGRKRNLEAEAAEKYEQEKRQRVLNEQYDKWGKGLKQIKDREERLQDDLYEMSKSLARYADDADLDKQLREELKDGDPMLEYIKQKQIKGKRKPDPLQYQGYYAPNRFRIKPGYRWDGVDRSNGYEKKLFETTK